MKTYAIKEIFGPTLQGEGSYTGTVVKFLRFAGCNRWSGRAQDQAQSVCWFCDTDFVGGSRFSAIEILQHLEALGACKNLVISGGEPTLQLDEALLKALKDAGYHLHLETNGSVALNGLAAYFEHIVMSPKQSRAETRLEFCHDLKVLYPPPIANVTPAEFATFAAKQYYVQPIDDANAQQNLEATIAFCLQQPQWRLSLQTHKLIGVP